MLHRVFVHALGNKSGSTGEVRWPSKIFNFTRNVSYVSAATDSAMWTQNNIEISVKISLQISEVLRLNDNGKVYPRTGHEVPDGE
jgi:hypothetical protein